MLKIFVKFQMNRQALLCICSSSADADQSTNLGDGTERNNNIFAFEAERGYAALMLRGASSTSISPKAFCFDKGKMIGFSADIDKPNKLTPFSITSHDNGSSMKIEQSNKGWFVPGVILCSLYCRSLHMLVLAIGNHVRVHKFYFICIDACIFSC